ncbi:MAG: Hydrolase, HAD-superfamily, subfamily, partial [Aeromicrobium sp.]|nr:Hydrolase, HAD-superfamily, subfamily [Aeromicrobium sp.]
MTAVPDTTVVVPSIGRASLGALLDSLDRMEGATPPVVVVDDRPAGAPLTVDHPFARVVRSGGRGPAAARNRGRREARTTWVTFLDDDVVVTPDWITRLALDLAGAPDDVVAIQGRVRVPLPADRRPRDAERSTASLETARWITADMTVRRAALRQVGGFDERFRRAYREDADLALRLGAVGRLAVGNREVLHPLRTDDDWFSVRQQRGNADDVLMRRLHGPDWRQRAEAPLGRRPQHLATVALAMTAGAAAVAGRPRVAAIAGAGWLASTAEFAARRILPGPRDRREVVEMLTTSVLIPPAATRHWLAGVWRHRSVPPVRRPLPAAVLVDRDGTLVHDVPYNGDPAQVRPLDGARDALDRLRAAGLPVAVISNQSGVSRGLLTMDQ